MYIDTCSKNEEKNIIQQWIIICFPFLFDSLSFMDKSQDSERTLANKPNEFESKSQIIVTLRSLHYLTIDHGPRIFNDSGYFT